MKRLIGITIVSLITTVACGESRTPSQQELERTITGIHTKTFSVTNLYANPLDPREWYDVIATTQKFVREHYEKVKATSIKARFFKRKTNPLIMNQGLMKAFEKIKEANAQLIKNINAAYAELFESNGEKDPALIERFSRQFENIEKKMDELKIKLKKDLDDLKIQIKNELSETKKQTHKELEQNAAVLYRLAITLKTTALKARNDLNK